MSGHRASFLLLGLTITLVTPAALAVPEDGTGEAPETPSGAAPPADSSSIQGTSSGDPGTAPKKSIFDGPLGGRAPAPLRPASPVTDQPVPRWRVVFNNSLFLRYNPLGLEDQLRAGAQRRFYESKKLLTRDNFFFFGIFPRLNPAFTKLGPGIEFQPFSIFNLRAAAEFVYYFSSFGFLQSFATPLADYSDSTLNLRRDNGLNYATYGLHVYIEPLVQLKFGPFVVRNKFAAEYWRMRVRSGDTVWYEVTLDTLVPRNGWVLANDLDALYLTRFGLTAGVRYSAVRPIYRDSDYLPGDNRLNPNGHHRLGPLLAYTFYDRGFTRFNRPTLVLIVNWYLEHRWRTGADVSPALPYLVVGFGFQSDVLK